MFFSLQAWLKIKTQRDAEEAEKRAVIEEAAERERNDRLERESAFRMNLILRHAHIGAKGANDDLDGTLVDVETFARQGKIQPFTISCASSALLLLDLHSHLSKSSVNGYLAGHWDLNTHNLAITHAFPCLTTPDMDTEEMAKVEYEIYNNIYSKHLTLVGWYRSNRQCPRALPTLRDCESQLDNQVRTKFAKNLQLLNDKPHFFQVKLLGSSDATYCPCVGLINVPFTSGSNESDHVFYWVVPPPESNPNDYGKPMKMSYTKVTDPCLSQDMLDQLDKTIRHFVDESEEDLGIEFQKHFNSDTTFITKMGRSLLPKFPRDQDERLWRYIRVLVLGTKHQDTEDPLVSQHRGVSNGDLNGHGNNNNEEEEEEIDDDEENALRGGQRTSSRANSAASSSQQSTSAKTDAVITMLLQKQSPQAPAAHGASTSTPIQRRGTNATEETEEEAPLDFSAEGSRNKINPADNGHVHDSDEDDDDEDKLCISEDAEK